MKQTLRIGSRASALAVTQTHWVAQQLTEKNPDLEIVFKEITTTGDVRLEASLSSLGGKGVFVKEIEDALLKKEIDLAVHSLKDVPQELPSGLVLAPFPKREDFRDAVISRFGEQLGELPRGSIIGTSSPRRQAQIQNRYKKRSYRIESIRGNLDTRIKKLHDGQYDAIILALAGLRRLGLEKEVTQILEPTEMMPAPGQGCLGLECRDDDSATLQLMESIKDVESDIKARAERAFLQGVGGDCFVPLACIVTLAGDQLTMEAMVLNPTGETKVTVRESGDRKIPELVGAKCAGRLLLEGGELL